MTSFEELDRALVERKQEWDDKSNYELSKSFHANELAGEIAEAVEVAQDIFDLAVSAKACNIVKKLERESYGLAGSRATRADLGDELADVVICAAKLANRYGLDLGFHVRRKFNSTSEKLGLKSMMQYESAR